MGSLPHLYSVGISFSVIGVFAMTAGSASAIKFEAMLMAMPASMGLSRVATKELSVDCSCCHRYQS